MKFVRTLEPYCGSRPFFVRVESFLNRSTHIFHTLPSVFKLCYFYSRAAKFYMNLWVNDIKKKIYIPPLLSTRVGKSLKSSEVAFNIYEAKNLQRHMVFDAFQVFLCNKKITCSWKRKNTLRTKKNKLRRLLKNL